MENPNIEICYPDSNRIGKFKILHEHLRDGARRPMWQSLFGLCVVLGSHEDESGRGMVFYAASDLFQEVKEGEEIPEYRIEHAQNMPFPDPEHQARRLDGGAFGWVAVRKIILRVPPLQMSIRPHAVH